MITDYASLVSFVTDHLQLDAETEAQIPAFIGLAEAALDRMLTVPERETASTLTTTANVSSVPLPVAARQVRTVFCDGDYPLSPVTLNVLLAYSENSGRPQVYAISEGALYLSPTPDAAYSLRVTYLSAIPGLSYSNTSNWLIERHPDAYVYSVLMQAEAFRGNDTRIGLLSSALDGVIAQINEQGNRYRSAAPMRLRSPGVVV